MLKPWLHVNCRIPSVTWRGGLGHSLYQLLKSPCVLLSPFPFHFCFSGRLFIYLRSFCDKMQCCLNVANMNTPVLLWTLGGMHSIHSACNAILAKGLQSGLFSGCRHTLIFIVCCGLYHERVLALEYVKQFLVSVEIIMFFICKTKFGFLVEFSFGHMA